MSINLNKLIYPYFVTSGENKKEEIKSFPGVFRYSLDRLIPDIKETRKLGIKRILLFGVPEKKDSLASSAYEEGNIVLQAIKIIKSEFPDLSVFTDVCLCAYTSHGHCRILKGEGKLIDELGTLKTLAKIALVHAQAGADWVCPSAVANGQVRVIRKALNEAGFKRTKILGYSAKFSSNFYGPFRNAADSGAKFGDRSGYQLDFSDSRIALKKIKQDIKEGADMVMVKPALSYLDVIKEASLKFNYPLVAYNTSGEYSLVKYGTKSGLWEEKKVVFEIINSIKRAGADYIITYHAKDIAIWLKH